MCVFVFKIASARSVGDQTVKFGGRWVEEDVVKLKIGC